MCRVKAKEATAMQQQTETALGRVLVAGSLHPETLVGSTDTVGAARFLALGVSTLQKLRVSGGGPEYVKASDAPNARVSYRFADLAAWQETRKRRNTAGTSPLKGQRRNETEAASARA
jgi:hypothetical protein